MKIQCSSCGRDIPAEDVNLDRLLAKCTSCDNLFDIEGQLRSQLPQMAALAGESLERAEVPMPKGCEVERRGKELTIKMSWFSFAVIFLTFFCVFWDGFMIVWYAIAISQRIWIMAAFGVLHGSIGIGLTYMVAASYVNTTTVAVDGRTLAIRYGPLPWPGATEIPTSELAQLYTKRRIHHGKHGSRSTFEVHALLENRVHKKLLGGLENSDQALWIEQEIEKHLGIEDRPVEGELDR